MSILWAKLRFCNPALSPREGVEKDSAFPVNSVPFLSQTSYFLCLWYHYSVPWEVSAILSPKSGLVFIWGYGSQPSLYLRKCVFPSIFEADGLVEAICFVCGWGEAQATGFSDMNNNDWSGHLSETAPLGDDARSVLSRSEARRRGAVWTGFGVRSFETSGARQSSSGVLPILSYVVLPHA